jgi:hypothetical protein
MLEPSRARTQVAKMTDQQRIELRIEPLGRELLDGVIDPDDEEGRRERVDVGLVPCFVDERPLQGLAGYIDWRSCGMLSRLVRSGWWSGAAGEALLMPTRVGLPVERLVLVGLGDSRDVTPTNAGTSIAAVVDVAHRLRPRSVLMAMPGLAQEREVVEAVFTGLARALAHGPLPAEDDDAERPAESAPHRWWVVAEERHVARLQRLLGGPPRPAAS